MLINLIKLIFIGNIVFFNNVIGNDLIEFSSIKQGEDSKFLHPSVRKYGDRVRFEVLIGIVNIDNIQSDIPVTRKLRFLTDCENKKFALLMVSRFDINGRLLKSMITPPGTEEYIEPMFSYQEEWINNTCEKF